MELVNLMEEHITFMITLVYYFIPAFVGAILTTYVKHISDDEKINKKTAVQIGFLMFFSALVPSILLAAFNNHLTSLVKLSSLRIGIAFIFGCIGDELLEVITSLKNMLAVLKVLSGYIDGLKGVAHISENIVSELNKDKPGAKPIGKPEPPVEKPEPDDNSNATQSYHAQFDNDVDNDYYVE